MKIFNQTIPTKIIIFILAGILVGSAITVGLAQIQSKPQLNDKLPQSATVSPSPPPTNPPPPPQYTVTITQTVNGAINPSTSSYDAGSTPSFTITPNSGYQIASITANGNAVAVATSAGQTYQFAALSGPSTLTATFTQITYSVTFTTNGGGTGSMVSPTGTNSYNVGQAVSITANPDSGYIFSSWSTTGNGIGFDDSKSATTKAYINSTGTITANFKLLSASISIDGQQWNNGTAIDWGTLTPGVNTIPISIQNNGTAPITSITLVPDSANALPSGWTETISGLLDVNGNPTTLAAGLTANGYLYLTPSTTTPAQTYNWVSYITIS
jgi:hypothetical protein